MSTAKNASEKMRKADSSAVKIEVIINTPMEAVFNFKCITAYDQNLEIRIENNSNQVIKILNKCDFVTENGALFQVDYLYPPAPQSIPPGDMCSYYCWMDETRFSTFRKIILYDEKGGKYSKKIAG